MAEVKKVLFKRGTAAQNDVYTGTFGEVTIDNTNKSFRLHDGTTTGGYRSATYSELMAELSTAFMDHSISSDHDGIYYRKTEIDSLVAGLSAAFDAQNTTLLIDDATLGWKDVTGNIMLRGNGATNPSWTTLRGGLMGYAFEPAKAKECWVNIHLGHDYALGTPVYPHIHWVPSDTATGMVRWGIEYSVAKGHQQGADSVFGPPSTLYLDTDITVNRQYEHFISEVGAPAAIPSDRLEPDSIIMMRIFREGTVDTFSGTVLLLAVDCHYQTERISTLNKVPDFYV